MSGPMDGTREEWRAAKQRWANVNNEPIESMVARLLHGRAWSDLSPLEGAIYDRLQDGGHMRTVRGILFHTPLNAQEFQPNTQDDTRHE